jgi:hypothetical protein
LSKEKPDLSEWQTKKHALRYLSRAHKLPHRAEGESVLLDQLPQGVQRVLDLGMAMEDCSLLYWKDALQLRKL